LEVAQLNSRKLVAVIAGISGIIGVVAIQAFQGGLTEQQFNLTIVSIIGLAGGGVTIQGIIDWVKTKVP
jgi:hypothetical protein